MQPQKEASQTKCQGGINERHIPIGLRIHPPRPEIHDRLAVDGRWRFLPGRHPEIRLSKPGIWALHKTRNAAPAFHRRLRRVPRNCGRAARAFRLVGALIAIPFIVGMIVAILSTRISLYLGTLASPSSRRAATGGYVGLLHEVRSEYAQLLTVVFLLIRGPGKWSLGAVFNGKQESRSQVVAASRWKESANASVMV